MSLPMPQKEHMVLAKDLVYKVTEDHTKALMRALQLADDAAPNDNGVKMVIMHTNCLNGIFSLYSALCAQHGMRTKEHLGREGRVLYAQMMLDLVDTGWQYIEHHLKEEPSK